jgi:glycosyltransferase
MEQMNSKSHQLPMLSLITVCYNSVETLGGTFDSVRKQQGVSFEYLVIDGASKDGTTALIETEASSNGSPVTFWQSEPDSGHFDAYNKGINRASGDVVGFLNADDELAGDSVLLQVCECFSDPDVVACYGDLLYVSRKETSRVVRYWKAGEFDHSRLKVGWMPPHPTVYVRRSWYRSHGGFNTSYKIAADYDLMLRLLTNLKNGEKVVYLPQVMVRMRTGGMSNRSLKNLAQKSIEDYRSLQNNGVGGIGSLALKNLGKVPQLFLREAREKQPSTIVSSGDGRLLGKERLSSSR